MSKRKELPDRPVKRKLPPVSCGHSPILGKIRLSKQQLLELKNKGHTVVQLEISDGKKTVVVEKDVYPGMVRNKRVYYYVRSDTGDIALRDFGKDSDLYARHRASPGKYFAGD
ncbi:MAG: hypothetical protein QXE05_00140 [Nitrososphaeria archaeon]